MNGNSFYIYLKQPWEIFCSVDVHTTVSTDIILEQTYLFIVFTTIGKSNSLYMIIIFIHCRKNLKIILMKQMVGILCPVSFVIKNSSTYVDMSSFGKFYDSLVWDLSKRQKVQGVLETHNICV